MEKDGEDWEITLYDTYLEELTMAKQWYPKKSKFHNEPVTVDGVRYDSKNEMRRFNFLKLMEKAGEISNLRYHVKYTLFPKGTVEIRRHL